MLTFLPLIGLAAQVILQTAGSLAGLNSTTQTTISQLLAGLFPLIGSLTSGQGKLQDALATLAALQGVLTTLMADTSLPADKLNQLKLLAGDVQAGMVAYVKAGSGFDASTYTPIQGV